MASATIKPLSQLGCRLSMTEIDAVVSVRLVFRVMRRQPVSTGKLQCISRHDWGVDHDSTDLVRSSAKSSLPFGGI